jgi:hypothetical protein
MSKITPLGHLDEESIKGQKEFFWKSPLVPWWVKLAHWLRPSLFERTQERKPTWCKYCGRKHDKRRSCEALHKIEDRTVPSTKARVVKDPDGNEMEVPIPNTPIGYYSTRTDT